MSSLVDTTPRGGEGIGDRLFDLNVEEVLDHWETEHAIREIIANALGEQVLTGTSEVEIFDDADGNWPSATPTPMRLERWPPGPGPASAGTTRSGTCGSFAVGRRSEASHSWPRTPRPGCGT